MTKAQKESLINICSSCKKGFLMNWESSIVMKKWNTAQNSRDSWKNWTKKWRVIQNYRSLDIFFTLLCLTICRKPKGIRHLINSIQFNKA